MPYQDLDLPRLRTQPYPEADSVKKASGIDFPTPTLIVATEGNRRVLRNSGIPRLVRLEKHFGSQLASTVIEYNLVILNPSLDEDERTRTLLHESAHSLSGYLRGYKPRFGIGDYFDASDGPTWQKALANRTLEEGFANYWEIQTIASEGTDLNDEQVILFHKAELDLRGLQIEQKASLQDPSVTESATYLIGHLQVLSMMRNLEGMLSKQETTRTIANSEPENMKEIMGVPPKILNLNLAQSLRYKLRNALNRF